MTAGAPGVDLARATLGMTAATAVSRLTGLVRILVVAAVLGPTFLGNVYQSANTVPNLVFELFVAGALQAALIPTLVAVLDHDAEDAQHVAGAVLGLAGLVLAALAALGMLAAPWVMALLVQGVDDPAVRADEIALGTTFLRIFLPQVLLYAAGLVATAVLNAHHRFVLPMAATVLNNVVVVAAYLVFEAMDGPASGLDLDGAEIAVLAGGTTLAVAAFTMVPVVAAARLGFSLRPRLDLRHPAVRRIVGHGLWAAAWLASTQLLLAVVLVLANSVEGGVVIWQVALTFFLLPHALFAVPVITALFPELSRMAAGGRHREAAHTTARGLQALSLLTVPAAVVLALLGGAAARVLLVGDGAAAAGPVGRTVVAFAAGLPAYGVFLYLTRVFYALGDARTPAVVAAVMAAVGGLAMVATALATSGADVVVGLAAAHSGAYVVAAIAMAVVLRRRALGPEAFAGTGRAVARHLAVAGAAGAAIAASAALTPEAASRWGVLVLDLAAPAAAGVAVLVLADRLLGGEARRTFARSVGAGGA